MCSFENYSHELIKGWPQSEAKISEPGQTFSYSLLQCGPSCFSYSTLASPVTISKDC